MKIIARDIHCTMFLQQFITFKTTGMIFQPDLIGR